MGIYLTKSISPGSSLGLWKMTETWQELLPMVHLSPPEFAPLETLTRPKRKQEWLACRVLFQEMAGVTPLIVHDENRKPSAPNYSGSVSFSHSGDFACVYISQKKEVGVDIQQLKPSISKGFDYFLNEEEQVWVNAEDNLLLHLIWSAKEAAFKYAGDADLDIRKHFTSKYFLSNQNEAFEVCIHKQAGDEVVGITYETFDDYVLTWTT